MSTLSSKDYAKILYTIEQEYSGESQKLALDEFLNIIDQRGALTIIETIKEEYKAYKQKQESPNTIEIQTAHPLDDEILEKLKTKFPLSSKISHKVNSELIGGIYIKINDRIFDSSIKAQLEQLRAQLRSKDK